MCDGFLLRELQIRGTLAGVAEALSFSPSSSQQLGSLRKESVSAAPDLGLAAGGASLPKPRSS
jgi:hypothetical protein